MSPCPVIPNANTPATSSGAPEAVNDPPLPAVPRDPRGQKLAPALSTGPGHVKETRFGNNEAAPSFLRLGNVAMAEARKGQRATQPTRGALWIIANVLSLPPLYAYWTLSNLFPSWRTLPSWTLRRAVDIKFIRRVMGIAFEANGLTQPDMQHEPTERERAELKSKYGARYVWMEGVDLKEVGEPVRGWADAAGVESARVPAYWVGEEVESAGRRAYSSSEEGHAERSGKAKVMLFFHGGCYITGGAHPSEFTSFAPINSLRHSLTLCATLSVEYRLSSGFPNPARNPFPAALLDAITSFRYLLSLGFKPHEILVCGDSAGGNLAVALVRYLVEVDGAGSGLGGLVLLSPWVDLSHSHEGPESSLVRNYETDYFLPSMTDYGGDVYCDKMSPRNPWISPAAKAPVASVTPNGVAEEDLQEAHFHNWPRTLLIPGGREMLLDESRTLRERMEPDGVPLVYKEWPDAPHEMFCMWFMEPDRTEGIKFVCRWIDGQE
ncbi:alpha/beta-hydrolase [Calocera viscosa TUFC12733]|uniref:Alpha/beta-hydrolase n=1 Tax=Calocera viscosa (strain TUFC12733) TaxID=1330018 RepID=A0A167FP44_CALVF|nr:alpha/beta-hydrolase [Calocera viscosa TUFC12733]